MLGGVALHVAEAPRPVNLPLHLHALWDGRGEHVDHVPEGLLLLVGVEDLDLAERPLRTPRSAGCPPDSG